MKTRLRCLTAAVLPLAVAPSPMLAQTTPETLNLSVPEEVVEGQQLSWQGGPSVWRSGDLSREIQIELKVTPGGGLTGSADARPGVDFEVSGPLLLTIPPRSSVVGLDRVIRLLRPDDGFPEPDRYLTIEVVNLPPGLTPGVIKQVIRIRDDDHEVPAHLDVTNNPLEHHMIQFGMEQVGPFGINRSILSPGAVTFLPLRDGHKLAFGRFTHVNGVARPRLARLDANDELDPSFQPQVLLDLSWDPIKLIATLPSGETLLMEDERMRLLTREGTVAASFQSPTLAWPWAAAPAPDGTVWVVEYDGRALRRLDRNGRLIASRDIGHIGGTKWFPMGQADRFSGLHFGIHVQPSGHVLLVGRSEPGGPMMRRFLPDGSDDAEFVPIQGYWLSVLPDERLAVLQGERESPDGFRISDLRLFLPNGQPDPSFPAATFGESNWSGIRSGVQVDEQGRAYLVAGGYALVNGLKVGGRGAKLTLPYQHRILLTGLPKTALQVVANSTIADGRFDFSGQFVITFRRLGSLAEPATIHYATRDITTTAGVDYPAQSGTFHFAALEAEKTLTIPVLADANRQEGDEVFELVVTGGEGVEALPVPLRLWIEGWLWIEGSWRLGPLSPPFFDRVKPLSDGRVLIEAWGTWHSSDDFPASCMEFSTDLKTWHRLTEQPAQSHGLPTIWLDASATNAATRYYRAVAR